MLKTSFETTDWVIMKKLKNQLQLAIIMKDKNHICDLCPSSFFYIYMLLCSGSQKSHLMYVAITDRCSISHAMLRRSVFPLWRSSIEKTVFFFFFCFSERRFVCRFALLSTQQRRSPATMHVEEFFISFAGR